MSGYALGTGFRVHGKMVKTVWNYTQLTTVHWYFPDTRLS